MISGFKQRSLEVNCVTAAKTNEKNINKCDKKVPVVNRLQGRSQPFFPFKPKLYSVSQIYQTLPMSNVGTGGLISFIPGRQQSNALVYTDAQLIPFPCGILLYLKENLK